MSKDTNEDLGSSRGSTLNPEQFHELLIACGFARHGSNWFVKSSSGVGPIFNLRIAPLFGCDGCCVQQITPAGNSVVDIPMPETEHQFRTLCMALSVELDA